MKKNFLLVFILTIGLTFFSGCSKNIEKPDLYHADNDNFKQSVILLNEARDLSNSSENENQPSFELSQEVEEKIFLNIKDGIRLGKLVNDDYLDFLHPELKFIYKNNLIRGTEIYYDGLLMTKSGNITEGTQKQMQGIKLNSEWINWFDKNGKEITNKVFGD